MDLYQYSPIFSFIFLSISDDSHISHQTKFKAKNISDKKRKYL